MRSYKLDVNKMVNRLVPHYLGGRNLILFLQSTLSPLQTLAEKWEDWATDQRTKSYLTSQVIMLEYYLNKKFNKYLKDRTKQIVISDGVILGIPVYWEIAEAGESNLVLYKASESPKEHVNFKWQNEKLPGNEYSFIVECPEINTSIISQEEVESMIRYIVNTYKIASKTFTVKFN